MPQWKISLEIADIQPHDNADSLDIAVVDFQNIIVRKGSVANGQIIAFAPKRSILPEELHQHYLKPNGESYLRKGYIVQSCKIRKELSEGVMLDIAWVEQKLRDAGIDTPLDQLIGQDISGPLGIEEYIAPIPTQLTGQVAHIHDLQHPTHDVESFRSMHKYFEPGELVINSEKIHGSQGHFIQYPDNSKALTSKGQSRRNLMILESPTNTYWQALHSTDHGHANSFSDICAAYFPNQRVDLFVEVLPIQPGYNYGYTTPNWRAFRLLVNNKPVSETTIAQEYPLLHERWTPYTIVPFDVDAIKESAKQKEGVSGKSLHISEGRVIKPIEHRVVGRSGTPLYMKVINPAYKGEVDDDALS